MFLIFGVDPPDISDHDFQPLAGRVRGRFFIFFVIFCSDVIPPHFSGLWIPSVGGVLVSA